MQCDPLTGRETKFKGWQYGYMHYCHPNIDDTDDIQRYQNALKAIDWKSDAAKAFRAGWKEVVSVLKEKIDDFVPELFEFM